MHSLEQAALETWRKAAFAFSLRFERVGMRLHEPTIEIRNADPQRYTSEIRAVITKDGMIEDVVELLVFLNGEERIELQKIFDWVTEELEEILGQI